MPETPPLERRLRTSPVWLLHVRLYLHAGLPLVLVLLLVVILVDLLGLVRPAPSRYLMAVEYGVLAYFGLELGVDFGLYRDRLRFLRDRWLDIALLVPILVFIQLGAWLGGVGLVARAYLTLKFISAIKLEAYALEELAIGGTRLQRWLKLTRRVGQLVRREPDTG